MDPGDGRTPTRGADLAKHRFGTPKLMNLNPGRVSGGRRPGTLFGTVSGNLGVENVELSSSAPGHRRQNGFRNEVPTGDGSDPLRE